MRGFFDHGPMKPGLILLFVFLTTCSQKKHNENPWVNVCPDLSWLESIQSSIVNSGNKGTIYLAHYKEERVFEINPCTNCSDMMTTVYDCDGSVTCEFGGLAGLNTCPDYAPNPSEKLLYWKN